MPRRCRACGAPTPRMRPTSRAKETVRIGRSRTLVWKKVLSQPPIDDPATTLGARVRALRYERGMTLKALGALAGLSHPFLSQLERGLARPSIGSAERIARALQVPVGELWGAPPRHPAETRVLRRGEGASTPHPQPGAPGGMRELAGAGPFSVREWSGGSRQWPEQAWVATGEVVLYVVRGAIELDLEGTVIALEEGDALRFDGALRHRLRRSGGPGTRALLVSAA